MKGVSFHKNHTKPWSAKITINYKAISLGYFQTEKEAGDAYIKACEERGLQQRLNIPLNSIDYHNKYYQNNRQKILKEKEEYRNKNREIINLRYQQTYERVKERKLNKQKDGRMITKEEVMFNYGGVCVCCGESRINFLTIDHIHNDGKEHLKSIGIPRGGHSFYKWLRANDYPKDNFRILCWNCNCSRAHNEEKICSHQIDFKKILENENLY